MQLEGCTEQETRDVIAALLAMHTDPKCEKCNGFGVSTNQWGARNLCSCVILKGQKDAT